MYKIIAHTQLYFRRPLKRSTWMERYSTNRFWVLLIESDRARARQAVLYLNQLTIMGTLRGTFLIIHVTSIEKAYEFIEENPDWRFRFIFLNGIDHAESLHAPFRLISDLQEISSFKGDVAILTNDTNSPVAKRILDVHTQKRATETKSIAAL